MELFKKKTFTKLLTMIRIITFNQPITGDVMFDVNTDKFIC